MSDDPNKSLEEAAQAGWTDGLTKWNNPTLPTPEIAIQDADFEKLKEQGTFLRSQLAFMDVRTFQTYINAKRIAQECAKDAKRGFRGVSAHEQGHKFCPYDRATATLLEYRTRQAINTEEPNIKAIIGAIAKEELNQFCDANLNTHLVQQRKGDDTIWTYQQLLNNHEPSTGFKVYMHSMEIAWNTELLPKTTTINQEERTAAESIARLFTDRPLDSTKWEQRIQEYARLITPFMIEDHKEDNPQEKKDTKSKGPGQNSETGQEPGKPQPENDRDPSKTTTATQNKETTLKQSDICSSASHALPQNQKELEEIAEELLRRLCKPGPDGLPTNQDALKELQEIGAGYGAGNSILAPAQTYLQIAKWHTVQFAKKPYGGDATRRLGLKPWTPSHPIDKLDIEASIQNTGRIIPGYGTVQRTHHPTPLKRGEKEIIPNLEINLDTSGSTPDPTKTLSLLHLSSTAAANTAIKKGALVQANNFWSGPESPRVQPWTRNIDDIIRVLMEYHPQGGTVFPCANMLAQPNYDPKIVLIVTDADITNIDETCNAIQTLLARNKQNRVTVYAINSYVPEKIQKLRNAGATVPKGSNTEILKHMIGDTNRAYERHKKNGIQT